VIRACTSRQNSPSNATFRSAKGRKCPKRATPASRRASRRCKRGCRTELFCCKRSAKAPTIPAFLGSRRSDLQTIVGPSVGACVRTCRSVPQSAERLPIVRFVVPICQDPPTSCKPFPRVPARVPATCPMRAGPSRIHRRTNATAIGEPRSVETGTLPIPSPRDPLSRHRERPQTRRSTARTNVDPSDVQIHPLKVNHGARVGTHRDPRGTTSTERATGRSAARTLTARVQK
jgi:hypothetical protein